MKNLKNKILAGAGLAVLSVGSASAAVSAGVTTALGDSATDVATVGGLVLVAIVGAATFKYIRKAL
jgi:hypothetical protein